MTSSSSTSSPHQKPLKKRLAAVARKTQNRVCCDCPEKAPTWAVILPPPENAPLSSRDLVAFVCFNCASIHRQLGMSLVRSIALDEWTEYDVESAEQSGNKYVNRIYEGNLKEKDTHSDTDVMLKPIAGAHIASRQRFIKEKYVQQTYYSQAAHFQHIAQRKIEPSTPSKSTRRSSLMVFLKSKDSPSVDKVAAAFAKADEGTISTSPSTGTYHDAKNLHHAFPMPVPFDSDLASVQQQQQQHEQQQQQRRTSLIPFSLSSSLTTTESSSPPKTSMRPRVSIFSKRTSLVDLHSSDNTGWDLATSTKDDANIHSISRDNSDRSDRKVSSKTSSDQKKRRSSGRDNKEGRGQSLERDLDDDDQEIDILEPPNHHQKASPTPNPSLTTTLEKIKGLKSSKRHEDYRDPRRANFNRSTGSIDFNLGDDNDDDANTRISAPVSSMARTGIVPATPRTPKPVLVASSVSTPSPTNSRMYLYAKNRGRSQSRARDKAVDSSPADHGAEDKKSSGTTTTRSRRVDRGRSTSAKPRHASPDKSRTSTTSDRPSSRKKVHSKRSISTPATSSTSRPARSTRDRTSGGGSSRVTSSPLRIHQNVSRSKTSGTEGNESAKSKSSTRHRSSDDTNGEGKRPRSSSARPRTDRTESRRRDETRERSSSVRPRADRVDKARPRSSRNDSSREGDSQTEKKATTTTTPTTPSSSRRSPSRSRSTRDGDGRGRSSRSTDRSQSRSRVQSRGQSSDDTKSPRVRRDNGTQRATRECTRSRSRSVDTLGELKRATTRRQSRSSEAIHLSESMNSKGMAHWDDSTDSHGLILDESIRTKEPSNRQSLNKSKVDDSSQSNVTTTKTREPEEHMKIVIKRRSSHNSCSSASFQSENSNDTSTKPERTRRGSRGSDATTKMTTAAPSEASKPKPLTSFLDKSLEGVVHEDEKGQSQPKDTSSLSSGTRQDHLDDNASLSLESALLSDEKSIKTAQLAKRSKRESILKEGEESFQVISAPGRSFKLNSRDKAKPTALAAFGRSYNNIGAGGAMLNDVDEMDESSNRHGGGHDAYEKSKLRLSRGKAAARHAERSSRKNEILAALDQTTTLSDEEWVGAPLRVVPERSKSTNAAVAVVGGGGAIRPMIRRSAPPKSRSEIGTKLSTNPALVLSKVKVDGMAAVDRRPGRSENARREGFHQSLN